MWNLNHPCLNRVLSGIFADMQELDSKTLGLEVSHTELQLIAEIDEFKGKWKALRTRSPERLLALRHVAIVESIGSSTRY